MFTLATAPLLAVCAPPRVTFALAASASGADVSPLEDVVLERTALEAVLRVWVEGASAAPVVERAALVVERAAVLPLVEVPALRRTAVPVFPVVPLLLVVPRFTCPEVPVEVVLRFVAVLRLFWLVVVLLVVWVDVPRLTCEEEEAAGAAVLLVAEEVLLEAVEVL